MKSSKGLARLGLGDEVGQTITAMLAGDAQPLEYSAYASFWRHLQSPNHATVFVNRLIDAVIETEKGAAKAAKRGENVEQRLVLLTNTLRHVRAFCTINAQDAIHRKVTKKWQGQVADSTHTDVADAVVEQLLTDDGKDLRKLMLSVVSLPVMDWEATPSAAMPQMKLGDLPFEYVALMEAIGDGHAKTVLNFSLILLARLPHQLRAAPTFAFNTLLALLHVLRQALMAHPQASPSWLADAIQALAVYANWPEPYCSLVRRTTDDLRREQLAPGVLMREQLAREVPQLVDEAAPAAGQRRVLLYADEQSEGNYRELLSRRSEAAQPNLHALRIEVLLQVFECDGLIPADFDVASAFRDWSDAAVAAAYADASAALAEALEAPSVAFAVQLRGAALRDIAARLPGLRRRPPSGEMEAPAPDESKGAEEDAAEQQDPVDAAHPAARESFTPLRCVPELPDLDLQFMTPLEPDFSGGRDPSLSPYLRCFSGRGVEELREEVLAATRGGTAAGEVRVAVLGDDRFLRRVVQAVVVLRQQHPELARLCRVRVFLLPRGENHVAHYLSCYDAWFRRQVFVGFGQHLLLPMLDADSPVQAAMQRTMPSHPDPAQRPVDPMSRVPALLYSYLREAPATTELLTYELECWTSSCDGGADFIVPFFQRVELGLVAAVAQFKAAGGAPADAPFAAVLGDRAFAAARSGIAPATTELEISSNRIDTEGREADESTHFQTAAYVALQLANVSCAGTEGRLPVQNDPTVPGLVCSSTPVKPSNATLLNKAARRDRDVDQLIEVTRAEADQVRVAGADIRVADAQKDIRLLVDGELAGPFKRVRIQLSQHGSVAMAHFFPRA